MERLRFPQSICPAGHASSRRSAIIKSILFLVISFSLCAEAFADHYRVTAPNGLNVRTSPDQGGEVLGLLPQDDVVDVTSMADGWALIDYNGRQGYVSTSYLTAAADNGKGGTSTVEGSWALTSWLLDSEGEAAWFTGLKWIVAIVIAIALVIIFLKVIGWVLGGGLMGGAGGLVIGFILKWLGWIESDTMWDMSRWGFYIGAGLGLLDAVFHPREVLDEPITGSGGSSSGRSGSGLKTTSFTVNGTVYRLTQDSPYSDCDYTDQFGGKWGHDSSGYHRK